MIQTRFVCLRVQHSTRVIVPNIDITAIAQSIAINHDMCRGMDMVILSMQARLYTSDDQHKQIDFYYTHC